MNTNKVGVPLEGFAEFSRKVAAEGAVLLRNEQQVLPITREDKISIFGRTQINYYRSGTGSGGSVNVPYTTNLLQGLREAENIYINEELARIYEVWVEENPFDNGGGGWAAEPWYQKEMPLSDEVVERASSLTNKAIVVIGRTAGEDKDNMDVEGSYRLTEEEQNMLRKVAQYFSKIIVVLNVSNIIDMSWSVDKSYNNPIQGIIYVWQGGIEGGRATADVLTGKVSPSGKLTDTIAYSIQDYPSTAHYGGALRNYYQEDIYVGYRYFETFCPEKVAYEFGYGLSYTEFEILVEEAKVIQNNHEPYIEIKVFVKNIGMQYAGKEVIQVYYEAPQGKLGKPKKELICFAKTRLLEPGKGQRLTLSFPVSKMASYDDSGMTGHKSAYVLEAGDYWVYVGNSIRNAMLVSLANHHGDISISMSSRASADHHANSYQYDKAYDDVKAYHIENLQVIEQLEEALAPIESFTRMKPSNKLDETHYALTYEPVPTSTINLQERIESNLPHNLEITGNQGFTLRDVYEEKVTLEAFVQQLTKEELATLVRGEGMGSPLVTPGTASCFGGVSDALFAYGLPIACTADGPSGIRMESGLEATQIPIGTLLAATWDIDLVEDLYKMEGQELARNQVDILLGPGMNIRRNPLNGRNFEYFSEDPLVNGAMAIAVTKGLSKGGAHATLKHFACNNQEKERSRVEAMVSERALREIYLKGFEMAVKEGEAQAIMTTYNPLNGRWTASNYDLNTTILRQQWGYKGIVMTDWWAEMNDVVQGGLPSQQYTHFMIRAQNDLYMVVNNYGAEVNSNEDDTIEALRLGKLKIGELQRSAINICRFLMKTPAFFRKQERINKGQHFKATESLSINGMNDLNPVNQISQVYDLNQTSRLKVTMNQSIGIKVNQVGTYQLLVYIMSPDTNLAQTACNMTLNGERVTTIQTSGTDGRWIKQKLNKVNLEKGFYELRLEVVKPNIEVQWIEFNLI